MNRQRFANLPPRMILYGGTGQCKVDREIIEFYGSRLVAVVDDTIGLSPTFHDVELLTGFEAFEKWLQRQGTEPLGFSVAIGNPHGSARRKIAEKLKALGLIPVNLVHPTAWVSANAVLGEGIQVMANAVISVNTRIGNYCIINTAATVDHDDILEDGVEIAPGATLCGQIHVEQNAWVCTGATVLPNIRIGSDAIVGAGAVVTKDVAPRTLVIGIPARIKFS